MLFSFRSTTGGWSESSSCRRSRHPASFSVQIRKPPGLRHAPNDGNGSPRRIAVI